MRAYSYSFWRSVPIGEALFFQFPNPPGCWLGRLVPGGLNPGGWNPVLVGPVTGAEPGGLNPGGWNGTEGGVVDGLLWFATGGLKPGGWNGVVVVEFWFGIKIIL